MSSKRQYETLINYLKTNKEEVLAFVKENTTRDRLAFVMVGQYDDESVVLSTAQPTAHFLRTNIQLGREPLYEKRLNEIIDRAEQELSMIVEGC